MNKILGLLLLIVASVSPAFGQAITGSITAQSTDCSVVGSCVSLRLASSAGGASITLGGTFSATLNFEVSGDNGVTWTAASTASATSGGVTNISVAGYTNLRVRCNPFTSGTVNVTLYSGSGSIRTGSSSGGTGSASFPASPVMGYYLSAACPTSNTGLCFNTFADTQQAIDCSWTNASPTVTCNTNHFTTADIGKRVFGYQNCGAFINLTANTNNNPITTGAIITISAVPSAASITMSGNATSTVATKIGCVIWGHPDDAGAAAMDTSMQGASFCPKAHFAAAYYMFTVPHFTTIPTSCANAPPCFFQGLSGCQNAGNMLYAAGYEFEGRGTGPTTLWMTPGFPETGSCNFGKSGKACWVVTTEGRWHDLQISGGGQYTAANITDGTNLIEVDGPASLDNFTCTNWAGRGQVTGTTNGIGAYLWTQLLQDNISACGTQGLATNVSSSVTAIRLSIDNPIVWGISVGSLTDYYTQNPLQFDKYNMICYDCRVFGGTGFTGDTATGAVGLFLNKGLSVKLYHSTIGGYNNPVNSTNTYAYRCDTTAGCTLDAEDTYMDMTGNGTLATTGWHGIWCVVNCTNILKNTIVKGSSSGGSSYTDTAGSKLIDYGGNVFGAGSVISGTVLNATVSANTTACATGNFALTSGWGTSSVASVAANGTILGCHVTITGAAGGAGPVLTWTYPSAPLVAPGSCHITGAISGTLTGVTTGTPGATSVAYTFAGTPSAQTYIFDVGCP